VLFYLDQVRPTCPSVPCYHSNTLSVHTTHTLCCPQNISVRAVNACKLRKGEAYHADLLALALVVGGLSLCGLPWVRPYPY
jgi:hypothetical protein